MAGLSRFLVVSLAPLSIGSCDCGGGGEDPGAFARLGPEGGSVVMPDGTEARFPAGALGTETEVRLERRAVTVDEGAIAPGDAQRLGDDEIVLLVDPGAVVGRYEVILRVAAATVPAAAEAEQLFVSQLGETGEQDESGASVRVYNIAWTEATQDEDGFLLVADLPPPGTPETRLSAWLAPSPVFREPVGTGDATGEPGALRHHRGLFTITHAFEADDPPANLDTVIERLSNALVEAESFFRVRGYLIPEEEQPVIVVVTDFGDLARFCANPLGLCNSALGVFATNGIAINASSVGETLGTNPSDVEIAAAHELFHGYQYWSTSFSAFLDQPGWFGEGAAAQMMDEAFDDYPSWFICHSLTTVPLDQASSGTGCVHGEYETNPFFRWLGPDAARVALDEASVAAASGATVDVASTVLGMLEPPDGRRYFDFVADFLYLKRTERTDATPDARGLTVGEEDEWREQGRADLWSECRMGDPFAFVDPGAVSALSQCPAWTAAGRSPTPAMVVEQLDDATARAGGSPLDEELALAHLTGRRFDLVNGSGRTQRMLLWVRATSGSGDHFQARLHQPDSASIAAGCDGPSLSSPLECEEDVADGERRVLLIASNAVRASEDGAVQISWRVLPVSLLAVGGDGQSGMPETLLTQPLAVEVQDLGGVPLGGVRVRFSVTEGGGSLSAAEVTTSDSGRAEVRYTLGPEAGPNSILAEALDPRDRVVASVTFGATAQGAECPVLVCDPICGETTECCSGLCVDTAGDLTNCGACGNRCSHRQACTAGDCTDAYDLYGPGRSGVEGCEDRAPDGCPEGQALCHRGGGPFCVEYCVDLSTSAEDCGECGTACLNHDRCVDGRCVSGYDPASCSGWVCAPGEPCCPGRGGGPSCASFIF